MRKIFITISAVLSLIAALTACSDSTTSNTTPTETVTTTTSSVTSSSDTEQMNIDACQAFVEKLNEFAAVSDDNPEALLDGYNQIGETIRDAHYTSLTDTELTGALAATLDAVTRQTTYSYGQGAEAAIAKYGETTNELIDTAATYCSDTYQIAAE